MDRNPDKDKKATELTPLFFPPYNSQRWSRGVWAKSKAQFPGTFAENGANIRVYVDAPTSTCGRKRKAAEANGAATESTATSAVGAIKKTDSTAAPTITVSDDDATSAESEGEEKPEEEKKKDATLPANGSLTIDHYFKPLGSADKAKNEKCKVKRIRFI